MENREKLDYPQIYDFFISQNNIYKVLPIINREKRKNTISLSLLDWFVTNYTKNVKVQYYIGKKLFDVHSEYKAQLTVYSKKLFDPFNRKNYSEENNIIFSLYYSKTEYIETTFKQLNFLKWALKNKVIKFIDDNIDILNEQYQKFRKEKENEKKSELDKNKKEAGNKKRVVHNQIPKKPIIHRGTIKLKLS